MTVASSTRPRLQKPSRVNSCSTASHQRTSPRPPRTNQEVEVTPGVLGLALYDFTCQYKQFTRMRACQLLRAVSHHQRSAKRVRCPGQATRFVSKGKMISTKRGNPPATISNLRTSWPPSECKEKSRKITFGESRVATLAALPRRSKAVSFQHKCPRAR